MLPVRSVSSASYESRNALSFVEEWLRALRLRRIFERVRMDQFGAEAAEEELAHEARMRPLGLARLLGDVARFGLGRVRILGMVGHALIPSASGVRAPRPRRPRRGRS